MVTAGLVLPLSPARTTGVVLPSARVDAGVGTTSDEDLMAAYVDGEPRAFERLFERYATRLHGFFARSFRSRATADDLLQTTFLKVHAARATYERGRSVRAWLFTIAARVRVDELRKRNRIERPDETLDERVFEITPSSDWPEANEAAVRVRAAVDALPEGQRLVVLLHRFEGLSFPEIADVLAASEGRRPTDVAVRVRAFRAYEVLRRSLADLEEAV